MSDLIHEHFTSVAKHYNGVRVTDAEPIDFICDQLRGYGQIEGADVGCGPGRYSLELLKRFGDRLHLHCVDSNAAMLETLQNYVGREWQHHIKTYQASADLLPLDPLSLDAVFTFNAVHHFDLPHFLYSASHELRDGGLLFIYTRSPHQNAESIWGKFFPEFVEKESRLYERSDVEQAVSSCPHLRLVSEESFHFPRTASMDELLFQARHQHYSTFALYKDAEFKRSLLQFQRNIRESYTNLRELSWDDQNIMYVIKRDG